LISSGDLVQTAPDSGASDMKRDEGIKKLRAQKKEV
jgi:hypothetical protein